MGVHEATVIWERGGQRFVDNRYKRKHRWEFDGGASVDASASPHNVPVPLSDESAVDPEEAFVAALASCHMLWFLSIAAKRGHVVESYRDRAIGVMGKDPWGKLAMTNVTLRPHVVFASGTAITEEALQAMHEEAHAECFIANSVKTELTTVPSFELR